MSMCIKNIIFGIYKETYAVIDYLDNSDCDNVKRVCKKWQSDTYIVLQNFETRAQKQLRHINLCRLNIAIQTKISLTAILTLAAKIPEIKEILDRDCATDRNSKLLKLLINYLFDNFQFIAAINILILVSDADSNKEFKIFYYGKIVNQILATVPRQIFRAVEILPPKVAVKFTRAIFKALIQTKAIKIAINLVPHLAKKSSEEERFCSSCYQLIIDLAIEYGSLEELFAAYKQFPWSLQQTIPSRMVPILIERGALPLALQVVGDIPHNSFANMRTIIKSYCWIINKTQDAEFIRKTTSQMQSGLRLFCRILFDRNFFNSIFELLYISPKSSEESMKFRGKMYDGLAKKAIESDKLAKFIEVVKTMPNAEIRTNRKQKINPKQDQMILDSKIMAFQAIGSALFAARIILPETLVWIDTVPNPFRDVVLKAAAQRYLHASEILVSIEFLDKCTSSQEKNDLLFQIGNSEIANSRVDVATKAAIAIQDDDSLKTQLLYKILNRLPQNDDCSLPSSLVASMSESYKKAAQELMYQRKLAQKLAESTTAASLPNRPILSNKEPSAQNVQVMDNILNEKEIRDQNPLFSQSDKENLEYVR